MLRTKNLKDNPNRYLRISLALLLSLMLVLGTLIPTYSFAEDGEDTAGKTEATEPVKKEEPRKEAPAPKKEEAKETYVPENDVAEESSESESTEPGEQDGADDESDQATEPTATGEAPEATEENEEEEMPAQSFSGSAGGVSVTATAGKGVFPKGTKMTLSPVSSSYVIDAADKATGEKLEVVDAAAVDINFNNKGREIQPEEGSVSVKLNSGALDGEVQEAVHVTSGGGVEIIGGASGGYASFRADHFSIYGIIGGNYESGEEELARYTYIFKVNGKEVDRQIARDGDRVTAPDDPLVEGFEGWQIEGEGGMASFPYTVTIDPSVQEDVEITVNAVIGKTCNAVFYADKNKTQVLETKTGKTGETITTTDVSHKFPDGSAITGWTVEGTGTPVTQVTFEDKDVALIPVISEGVYTVTFDTGEGSPIPAIFVESGKKLAKPEDPVRGGYIFKGWFMDAAGAKAYDFSQPVTSDLRLYAVWEGATTSYKVVYWQENPNDDGYTIARIDNRSGKAGGPATYVTHKWSGFTLNQEKSNQTVIIKGDGTSIMNVYYDRLTYPLTMYVREQNGTNWFGAPVYSWVLKVKEEFKYKQDTSDVWYAACSDYPGYDWFTEKDGDVSYSAPPAMEPAGGGNLNNFKGITVYGKKQDGECRVQYLDRKNKTLKVRPDYVGSRTGWKFTKEDHIDIPGWTFDSEGDVKWVGKVYTGTLYYTRNSYSLNFDPQDGSSVISTKDVPYETSLSGYVPGNYKIGDRKTFDGVEKYFVGWYDNESGIGDPVDFSTMKMPALPTKGDELMFYGKWIRGEHTVAFDLDGGQYGDSDSIESQVVESGNCATAPDSTMMNKDGFIFGGWMDENGVRFSFDTRITNDTTVKAIWNSDKSKVISISYDLNGGSGDVADGRSYYDGSYAVIAGQPTAPEGRYFKGWKIGTSDLVIAGGSFRVNLADAESGRKAIAGGILTLSAQYEDLPTHLTSVVYNANGGKFGSEEEYIDNNAVINGNYTITGEEPAMDEHKFLGWSRDADATEPTFKSGESVASGKEGNVLYAVWEKEKQDDDEEIIPVPDDDVIPDDGKVLPDMDEPSNDKGNGEGNDARVAGVSSNGGVQTGDDTFVMMYIAMMLAVMATAAIVITRRNNAEEE